MNSLYPLSDALLSTRSLDFYYIRTRNSDFWMVQVIRSASAVTQVVKLLLVERCKSRLSSTERATDYPTTYMYSFNNIYFIKQQANKLQRKPIDLAWMVVIEGMCMSARRVDR